MDDWELLDAYRRGSSDEAFAALASRYIDLVYSAALRQVQDPEQARDVAQAVFVILARKANSLGPSTILAGWFYRTARFVAMEAHRAEKRRKMREESMASEIHDDDATEQIWKQIAPHLDQAMAHLGESDRTAILLRFFQDRSLRELAGTLGISEEAAKKRVRRALERLRQALSREGITSSSSLLGATLIACAIERTPASVAAMIISTATAPGAAATAAVQTLTKGAIQMITVTKVQASAAAAMVLAILAGSGIVGVQHARTVREHARLLGTQQLNAQSAATEEQSRQLLARRQEDNQRLRAQARELYHLRDKVTQLRGQVLPAAGRAAKALNLQEAPPHFADAAEQLRELQFEHFVVAGQIALSRQPLTEEQRLAYVPEIDFMKNIGLALRIYSTDHANEFPPTIEALLATDILSDAQKERFRSGPYDYLHFKQAETKPGLPAVWWRAPDELEIRVLVFTDGRAELLREPAGIEQPGQLALSQARN